MGCGRICNRVSESVGVSHAWTGGLGLSPSASALVGWCHPHAWTGGLDLPPSASVLGGWSQVDSVQTDAECGLRTKVWKKKRGRELKRKRGRGGE